MPSLVLVVLVVKQIPIARNGQQLFHGFVVLASTMHRCKTFREMVCLDAGVNL
jgi:predicted membrane channel-forming protein YqfA (hemolysin III family)